MKLRFRSLRSRLLLRMSLLLLPLLVLSCLHAYLTASQAADTAYDRSLLLAARSIAERLHDAQGQLLLQVPYLALDNLAWDSSGQIYYQILNQNGELLSGYENLPAPPEDTPLTTDYPALARFYDGDYQNQPVRLISLLQPEASGMLEIRLAETRSARKRLEGRLLSVSLWHLGLLAASVLLLSVFAVQLALRPLGTLQQMLSQRRSGDLQPLSLKRLPREVLPLVKTLNHFHRKLRRLFSQQSAFISDAAHELRTPLAALKARIELGQRSAQPEDWQLALKQAGEQSERLISLANQLLSLARIESGAQAIADGASQPVNLTLLTRETAQALAALAHQRGLTLELFAAQPVWIKGEANLLCELLGNLIDNALCHAQSRVILRVSESGLLEVEDDGCGLPEADYSKAFARFWQQQDRQNRSGVGLGLAIVQEICRAHQASISLHPAQPSGLLVRVQFARLAAADIAPAPAPSRAR
ncbi:histidine kinase [Ventosimonas gracilis]|uniref:histidine kinase n=1 Tax=Ventosimonas gracilis TaxID=1680762 RepID=A0A139SJ84_9GAMM|nr:sensor histidine kinase [Ventosimonas gracilis]KXU34593.1 histidine kinase [Ventosimonas gracilis]